MKERFKIDKRRKVIVLSIIAVVAIQLVLIGMIAEKTFMVRDMGVGIERSIEEVRKDLFDMTLKNQSSRIETIRESWRSMYGMIGGVEQEDVDCFLFNVVSIVESVDGKEEILVIERNSGEIVFPFERAGELVVDKTKDERMVMSIISSRDVVYPNYFVGSVAEEGERFGKLLMRSSAGFGEDNRIFYNKVVIPRPRTGEIEYVILAGFRESRVSESYKEYSNAMVGSVENILGASQISLNLVMSSMVAVIILGFIIAYGLKFIVWDIYNWEIKKEHYEECVDEINEKKRV